VFRVVPPPGAHDADRAYEAEVELEAVKEFIDHEAVIGYVLPVVSEVPPFNAKLEVKAYEEETTGPTMLLDVT
jgi:hypothetical protein